MDNRTAEFLSFNSTLVQLKVEIEPGVWVTQVGFNSTLVQLKDGFLCHKDLSLFSFNSTLVQLKASCLFWHSV